LPTGVPVTHHLLTAESFMAISAVFVVVDSIIWASSKQIRHHSMQTMGEGMAMYLFGLRNLLPSELLLWGRST